MVTVVSPASSPVPVYNRSGATVSVVTATGADDPATAAQIVAYSGWTIVVATGAANTAPGVVLPVSPDVGDVVEIYAPDSANGVEVVVWETTSSVVGLTNLQRASIGTLFRYLGATYGWGFVGPVPS